MDAGRATPGRCGIDLDREDDAALRELAAFLDANAAIPTPDGPAVIEGLHTPGHTERETLRLARLGAIDARHRPYLARHRARMR